MFFVSPYLLMLGLLAKVAVRTANAMALLYLRAILAWMVILELWLISLYEQLAGQAQVLYQYLSAWAAVGPQVYLAGLFFAHHIGNWVRSGTTFLAFSIFLYWTCAKVFPASNIFVAFFSRETIGCATVLFYLWSVARLPRAPAKGL